MRHRSAFARRAVGLGPSILVAALAMLLQPPALPDCDHLDDPLQLLDLRLEMAPADWERLRDLNEPEDEVPADFQACDEAPIPVMVRRKEITVIVNEPNPIKISLKIDFDDRVADGEWHGHRKLSLESGRGAGRGTLLREGFAWQLFARAGVVAGASSWVRVHVNGTLIGVFTRIEEMDKSFLRRHLGEDDGFLYKLDYETEGLHKRLTREGDPDPFADDLCYPPFDTACSMPPDAIAALPHHLDVPQLFTLAAVNAFLANFDGPFFADNNYHWYNSGRPRMYFPWDLDLVLLTGLEHEDPHAQKLPNQWFPVLLALPAHRELYDGILLRLMDDAFSIEALDRFLDDLAPVVGPAMDADPFNDFDGDFANEVAKLRRFLRERHAYLRGRLPPSEPFPIVINEILAANASAGQDEGGRFADWVELYNRGAEPASLLGLCLSDDPANPRRWRLPDIVLEPGGTVLAWCDLDVEEGPLHTGFQLNADGESVGLYEVPDRAPAGIYRIVDFVRFGPEASDVAHGRLPDGAPGFRRLVCPTPGAPNVESCDSPGPAFLRGDTSGDGELNVSDAIRLLLGLFGGEPLPCERAADGNDDGAVNLTDAVVVLAYLFQAGPPGPPPFAGCGRDPTGDALGCGAPPRCP